MKMKSYLLILPAVAILFSGAAVAMEPHSSQRGKPGVGNYDRVLDSEFSLYYLPDEEGAALMTYIKQNEPPLLRKLSVKPENPGPGDPVAITAEIYNDPLVTRSKTLEVTVSYSIDGKETWRELDMADAGDGKNWTAVIPPAGAPATLHFYFTAMDDAENYYMEVPETDVGWASAEDEDYVNTVSDGNDVYTMVPDNLDILSVGVAYDGELIYVETKVEGEISGGTVTPFEVNVYSAGFYIPTGRREIGPKPRYVLEHSQHAQFITFPVIGLLDVEKGLAEIRSADARYYSHKDRLYMRMEKSVLDQHGADYVRLCFGTAMGLNAMPLAIDPKDVTSFINVVFGEHTLDIK